MTGMPLDATGSEWVDLAVWMQLTAEDNGKHLQRLRENLAKAMKRELTPRQREILELHYRQQLPVSQIALQLHVNRSTVYRTLRRAEVRLRRCLQYTL